MELRPHKISVTVSFPPDTDTPGFEAEQVGKPAITAAISEEGGLEAPSAVAEAALADALSGEFISSVGLNGAVLTSLCSGMMPTKSWLRRAGQVVSMSILRIVGLHFLYTCGRTVEKMEKQVLEVEKNKTMEISEEEEDFEEEEEIEEEQPKKVK